MSILKVICSPADVDFGGFTYETTGEHQQYFDKTRTEGVFRIFPGNLMAFTHEIPAGNVTWYHWRYTAINPNFREDGRVFSGLDVDANMIFSFRANDGQKRLRIYGDTSADTNLVPLQGETPYSIDLKIEVGANIVGTLYINGALYGEVTAVNTGGKGMPGTVHLEADYRDNYASEILVADEDTRGMRVREMRPKSFGIFQEWDGNINALRDSDLATGISTDTADRMVSFGVSNVEEVKSGDIINRVVMQSYAQKGETGLSSFQHFFRHKSGTVSLGAPQTLDILGDYYREEFMDNPETGLSWEPEDFASLQTGIKSLL